MISAECWKQSLEIFTMLTHSMQFLQTFWLHIYTLKPSTSTDLKDQSKIWKWLVSGYMCTHNQSSTRAACVIQMMVGWSNMSQENISSAVTPASPLCPVDTRQEGCVDLWCARFWPYHLPFAGRILQAMQCLSNFSSSDLVIICEF